MIGNEIIKWQSQLEASKMEFTMLEKTLFELRKNQELVRDCLPEIDPQRDGPELVKFEMAKKHIREAISWLQEIVDAKQ